MLIRLAFLLLLLPLTAIAEPRFYFMEGNGKVTEPFAGGQRRVSSYSEALINAEWKSVVEAKLEAEHKCRVTYDGTLVDGCLQSTSCTDREIADHEHWFEAQVTCHADWSVVCQTDGSEWDPFGDGYAHLVKLSACQPIPLPTSHSNFAEVFHNELVQAAQRKIDRRYIEECVDGGGTILSTLPELTPIATTFSTADTCVCLSSMLNPKYDPWMLGLGPKYVERSISINPFLEDCPDSN